MERPRSPNWSVIHACPIPCSSLAFAATIGPTFTIGRAIVHGFPFRYVGGIHGGPELPPESHAVASAALLVRESDDSSVLAGDRPGGFVLRTGLTHFLPISKESRRPRSSGVDGAVVRAVALASPPIEILQCLNQ